MSEEHQLWISRDPEGLWDDVIYFWESEPSLHPQNGFVGRKRWVGFVPISSLDNPIPAGTKKRIKGVTIVEVMMIRPTDQDISDLALMFEILANKKLPDEMLNRISQKSAETGRELCDFFLGRPTHQADMFWLGIAHIRNSRRRKNDA